MAVLETGTLNTLAFSLSNTPVSAPPAGFELAFIAILVTIMSGGIALGIGIGIRSRRMSDFGKEELLSAVINSALLGAFFGLISIINGVYFDYSASAPAMLKNCTMLSNSISNVSSAPLASVFASCEYSLAGVKLQGAIEGLLKSQVGLGYLTKITLNLPGASISPFAGFDSVLASLSESSIALSIFFSAANLYSGIFSAFSSLAMAIGFPAGFILRSFYPTRKLGSLLIAFSFGSIAILSLCALGTSKAVETAMLKSDELASISSSFSTYLSPALQADPNTAGFFTTLRSMFLSGELTTRANLLLGSSWSLVSYCALAFAILPAISIILTISFSYSLASALDIESVSAVYRYT